MFYKFIISSIIRFGFDAGLNVFKIKYNMEYDGAGHVDDLCYIFQLVHSIVLDTEKRLVHTHLLFQLSYAGWNQNLRQTLRSSGYGLSINNANHQYHYKFRENWVNINNN